MSAPAEIIFRVLADPAGDADMDGSGMVRGAVTAGEPTPSATGM